MRAVVDETSDVIFGHLGKLFLKQAFETCEDDRTLSRAVVVDDSEFDLAFAFFQNCRLGEI